MVKDDRKSLVLEGWSTAPPYQLPPKRERTNERVLVIRSKRIVDRSRPSYERVGSVKAEGHAECLSDSDIKSYLEVGGNSERFSDKGDLDRSAETSMIDPTADDHPSHCFDDWDRGSHYLSVGGRDLFCDILVLFCEDVVHDCLFPSVDRFNAG